MEAAEQGRGLIQHPQSPPAGSSAERSSARSQLQAPLQPLLLPTGGEPQEVLLDPDWTGWEGSGGETLISSSLQRNI